MTTEAQTPETDKQQKRSVQKKQIVLKKLDSEAAKLLATLKEKANKKAYGRKIRDAEILRLGLTLIEAKHLASLQEGTLSGRDRLSLAHEEHQKKNGKITFDEFCLMLVPASVQSATRATP